MEALAHTLPYDVAVCGPGMAIPADLTARIAIPTLVIDGANSTEWMRTAARTLVGSIAGAQHRTLAGQDHGVLHQPEVLVPVLTEFFA
jgi:hypothetical protein